MKATWSFLWEKAALNQRLLMGVLPLI